MRDQLKCNMYILHHITCNWAKFVGAGTLYVLASHKFLTLTCSDQVVRYIVSDLCCLFASPCGPIASSSDLKAIYGPGSQLCTPYL